MRASDLPLAQSVAGAQPVARGVSIHVGVNRPKTMSPLNLSEGAAWRMAELAFQAGYRAIHVLCGAHATCESVKALLADTARDLPPGDTLFVSYSGHGSQLRDDKRHEPGEPGDPEDSDGWDEAWCLHDGDLRDDELAACWRLLPAGSHAVVVIESCFAAGNARDWDLLKPWYRPPALPRPDGIVYRGGLRVAQKLVAVECVTPPKDDEGIAASVLVLAAAGASQKAQEGLYTRCLLGAWNGGEFQGSYYELHCRVAEAVTNENSAQKPQILMLGTYDSEFPQKRAFHLQEPATRG